MTLPRAAETGNSAEIQRLLHDGRPVDERGGFMDETGLIIAARHGNLGIMRTLLKAGADINAKSKYGDTALTASTYFCHPNVSEFLLEHNADVNVSNYGHGSTPLMLAAECGDTAVVKALINKGGDINAKNKKGVAALYPATVKGYTEIVQALLDAGATTDSYASGVTALYEAAQQGYDAIVRLLIAKDANIDARATETGWTPLMIAVAEGHSTTANILLAAGAKVNSVNSYGRSALMFAAWYGNAEITGNLLVKGADVNLVPTDKEGMTALIAATVKGYKEIVSMLLKAGADPNIRDKEGKTALAKANIEIALLLRQAGAKE
jgi:ankyrin repeat protein